MVNANLSVAAEHGRTWKFNIEQSNAECYKYDARDCIFEENERFPMHLHHHGHWHRGVIIIIIIT